MTLLKERYVIDENGEKVSVILDIDDFNRIREELEELDAMKAYDRAKASGEEEIPFEQAIAEIEKKRA